jgi:hypothetical protein
MRRSILMAVVMLALAVPAFAQVQGGNIAGTVTDEQGGLMPGVTVTLASADRTAEFTTGTDGRFRFLALPPGMYTLRVSLPGFASILHEQIEVRVGQNVEIPLLMRLASIAETITVTGESPLVDTKAMGTATNFTQDELARIPTSRDPWALLRSVPGVVIDRINIAGNETGQQSGFMSKGTRREDAVWTMDGIVITDMAATGASPTYFDYDAFDEIQISTAGQDIRQATGGVGLNFVVKRGTNQFRGGFKGYYTGEGLEASNVPDELKQASAGGLPAVTADTADHNKQISEYGFDLGGPLWRDKAWIWGSWVQQDIRLVRATGNLIDRTILKTQNVKASWQATRSDMVSVLWFLGAKEKYGRATGNASFEPPTATWNQGNNYPENRPHGLLKFQNDRVISSTMFATVKYAYYGTGFTLFPGGGLDGQAGISGLQGRSFGTTLAQQFLRPNHTVGADLTNFVSATGGSHEIKYGVNWRRADAYSQAIWPGDRVVGYEFSATDKRARLYREGSATNRVEYFSLYLGDTFSRERMTLDVGARYDRQYGKALPSQTLANGAFPALVPGIEFDGYDAPFTWSNFSPRAGLTYAVDATRQTLLRVSFSRYAGQLANGDVGYMNPTATAGYADYGWNDLNGDNLVTPNEVDLTRFITSGNGFNPASPTAVSSANLIDPDFKAPITTGLVVGLDRELVANLAVQVSYSWSRTTGFSYTPFRHPNGGAMGPEHYTQIGTATGTLPGGGAYSVPLFAGNTALLDQVGNGRFLTNYDGYASKFNGLEMSVVKRLSNRWMARFAGSWNQATEDYDRATPVNFNGNPTRVDTAPLISGGQFAPRSAGSGAGDVFINGKWQMNMNGVYLLPWDMEIAGNLFGKQGTPFPLQINSALGRDGNHRVLVSPELDTRRLDDVWNLDLRLAKNLAFGRTNSRIEVDLFNVMNGNYAINRIRNIQSLNFDRITQNLSPRILRFGVKIGF